MYRRQDYIERIVDLINERHSRVLNIYGEKGVGKSYIVESLKKNSSLTHGYFCGYLDFSLYAGMSRQSILNALYDLCDFLTAQKIVKLHVFEIADAVESKRSGRIPYAKRKLLSRIDTTAEVSDAMSQLIGEVLPEMPGFRELKSIGMGIKMLQMVSRHAFDHLGFMDSEPDLREKYEKMDDQRLFQSLPEALTQDINHREASDNGILVLVENYDSSMENASWLQNLIAGAPDVTWVFVSRQPIKAADIPVFHLKISPLSPKQLFDYVRETQKGLSLDHDMLGHIFKVTQGNPQQVDQVCEYIRQKQETGPIAWKEVEERGYGYVVEELLRNLSRADQEILFHLNFARSFDEELFGELFPGRLYPLYNSLFASHLFTVCPDGRLCVQSSVQEEVLRFMAAKDKSLRSTCYEHLFQAELRLLLKAGQGRKVSPEEVGRHMQNLFRYGSALSSPEMYLEGLLDVRTVLMHAGYLRTFCMELESVGKHCPEELQMRAARETVGLYLCISDFQACRRALETGRALAEKLGDLGSRLSFLTTMMELEYISPSTGGNAVEHWISMAQELLKLLNSHIRSIPYGEYVLSTVKAQLYLTKAYITQNRYDLARKQVEKILSFCEDPMRLQAFSLYSQYAKALQYTGEISAMERDRQKAAQYYGKALSIYRIAEMYQPYWEARFYLDYGLAYKRSAEVLFALAAESSDPEEGEAHIRQGMLQLETAVKVYEEVKARVPDMMDTYCKIGFACNLAAESLLDASPGNHDTEKYLRMGEENFTDAIDCLAAARSPQMGNRQLANIRCTLSRLWGRYYRESGSPQKAETCYQKSVSQGEKAALVAPEHPYGYLETSWSCAELSEFMLEQGRKKDAKVYVSKGLDALNQAYRYMDHNHREDHVEARLNRVLRQIGA